jgi:hypothetical protein
MIKFMLPIHDGDQTNGTQKTNLMSEERANRELTASERHLAQWMLEHGSPEARQFLEQLEIARVTPWRCQCGCASINFCIGNQPEQTGCHPVADFVFGTEDDLSGIFIFESNGVLAGLEVYGLAGDAPQTLPSPESLRPFQTNTKTPHKHVTTRFCRLFASSKEISSS